MKTKSLGFLLIVAMLSLAFAFTSCIDDSIDYKTSDIDLAYTSWKLMSIEPKGYNASKDQGFDVLFYDNYCMGKGDVNTFYSNYATEKGTSSIKLEGMYYSEIGGAIKAEETYFSYLQRACFYECIGDTILKLYPYATSKSVYLKFKRTNKFDF